MVAMVVGLFTRSKSRGMQYFEKKQEAFTFFEGLRLKVTGLAKFQTIRKNQPVSK